MVPASGSVENGGEAWFAGGWRAAARQKSWHTSLELMAVAEGPEASESGHRPLIERRNRSARSVSHTATNPTFAAYTPSPHRSSQW